MERNIFIGAKRLSEKQIEQTLPTYKLLKRQIEEIRETAKGIDVKKESERQYNNSILISGARGTGKTSIIYTIKEYLDERAKDIILPIVEPDNYSNSTKIMGAILGFFKNIVDDIVGQVKDKGYNGVSSKIRSEYFRDVDCRYKERNTLVQRFEEILEYYCYTEDEFRTMLTKSVTDMEGYKKKSKHLLAPDAKFIERLNKFINELILVKKELIHNEEEPLIVIFIDDIDLKTNKCKEIIDSIMKYICHSNIITIISADYNILRDSVTLALIQNENIIDYNLIIKEELFNSNISVAKRKEYLSGEYLKKVLPPAFRHDVILWDLKRKPFFKFNDNDDNNDFLYIELNRFMGSYNEECKDDNIFYQKYGVPFIQQGEEVGRKNKENKPELIYSIFDKTPRGLINVYYHLVRVNNRIIEMNEEEKFMLFKMIIEAIVQSNSETEPFKIKFFEKCIRWGINFGATAIDYDYFNLQKEEVKDTNKENVEKENEKIKVKLFFVAEIVKKLSDKIKIEGNYESIKKEILKEKLVERISNEEWKASISKRIDKNYENQKTRECIESILENLDVKFILGCIESINKDLKNELYKFLAENVYRKKYIEEWVFDREKYGDIVEFLDRNSIGNSNVEENINIMKLLIKDIGSTLGEKKTTDNIFDRYFKYIFSNYMDEIFMDDSKYKGNESKAIKVLTTVLEKRSSLNAVEIKDINKAIEKSLDLKSMIIKCLNNSEILPIIKVDNDVFQKFITGVDGVTRTKYTEAKDNIRARLYKENEYKENITLDELVNIIELAKELKLNSRIWYGYKESTEFINEVFEKYTINENCFEESEIFKINIESFKEALRLWKKYIGKFMKEEIEKNNIGELRAIVRREMLKAKEKAVKRKAVDLDSIGLKFEDIDDEIQEI